MRRDRTIAAALLLLAWAEQLSGGREQLALHLALAGVMLLPLAFAQRRPWLPGLACALALVAYGAAGSEPDSTGEILGLAGALFVAGSRQPLRPALALLAGLVVAGTLHTVLLGALGDLIFVVAVFLVPPFVLGRAVRGRRERIDELQALNRDLAEQRERSAALAAEIERARIQRDLEAIIARSLDAMVAQAREGERLAETDAPAAAAAFERIRADGAEATAELRRLLRLLHAEA